MVGRRSLTARGAADAMPKSGITEFVHTPGFHPVHAGDVAAALGQVAGRRAARFLTICGACVQAPGLQEHRLTRWSFLKVPLRGRLDVLDGDASFPVSARMDFRSATRCFGIGRFQVPGGRTDTWPSTHGSITMGGTGIPPSVFRPVVRRRDLWKVFSGKCPRTDGQSVRQDINILPAPAGSSLGLRW